MNTKLLLVSMILFSMPAKALIVLQNASAAANVDYDTNLNLREEKQDVWRYSITPRYSVEVANEKNRWFADGGLLLQRSSDENISADREDPNLGVGWQRELEKGQFSLGARYQKRSSRFAQFDTNALVDVDGSSVNRSVYADYSRVLTEKINFSVGANYSTNEFSNSSFVDSTTKSINSTANYVFNERITPFIQLGFTDFEPDGVATEPNIFNQRNFNNQSRTSRNISVGSNFLISPRLTFVSSIGVNRTSTAGAGWIANANLSYEAERSTFQGRLARTVVPGGLGDFQETDIFALNYGYELSDKSTLGADFNMSRSRSQFDFETTQLNTFYSRELSADWQMRVNVRYRNVKGTTFSAHNNNFGISLIYNIPQF